MLKNLVGVVTGAANGLGKGTLKHLASQGCNVVGFDIRDIILNNENDENKENNENKEYNEYNANNENNKINDKYENVTLVKGDVTSEEDVQNLYNIVEAKFDKLDFIVNCAGVSKSFKIFSVTSRTPILYDTCKTGIYTNLLGTLNVIRLGIPLLSKSPMESSISKVVIVTAGVEAYDGQTGQAILSAASGGLMSMTLPLARELSKIPIRCVCACPGIMDTKLTCDIPNIVRKSFYKACATPKRFGTPAEFGNLVQFIIENSYINAEALRMDAGLRMYMRT